jgi:hypothetical protein
MKKPIGDLRGQYEKDPFLEMIVDEVVELIKEEGLTPGTAIFRKSKEYAREMSEIGAALARRKL